MLFVSRRSHLALGVALAFSSLQVTAETLELENVEVVGD